METDSGAYCLLLFAYCSVCVCLYVGIETLQEMPAVCLVYGGEMAALPPPSTSPHISLADIDSCATRRPRDTPRWLEIFRQRRLFGKRFKS